MSDITAKLIGTNPPADAGRDAIHVAVVPVVAAECLGPGMPVALNQNGEGTVRGTPVGVVDPFLKAWVNKGDRFFLFLPPGSLTSLRHDWTHPAFDAAPVVRGAPAPWVEDEEDDDDSDDGCSTMGCT